MLHQALWDRQKSKPCCHNCWAICSYVVSAERGPTVERRPWGDRSNMTWISIRSTIEEVKALRRTILPSYIAPGQKWFWIDITIAFDSAVGSDSSAPLSWTKGWWLIWVYSNSSPALTPIIIGINMTQCDPGKYEFSWPNELTQIHKKSSLPITAR